MKTQSMASMLTLAISFTAILPTAQAKSKDANRVESVLKAYESALNDSDVDQIIKLYTSDAVFMAQHRLPAEGRKAVAKAYTEILGQIDLDIAFEIDEVEVLGDWAWARTRSVGTTKILAAGAQVQEGNQELFILRRTENGWRIARYIFSTTQPRG